MNVELNKEQVRIIGDALKEKSEKKKTDFKTKEVLDFFQKLQDVFDMTEKDKDVFNSFQDYEKKMDAKKRYENHQELTKEEYIYCVCEFNPFLDSPLAYLGFLEAYEKYGNVMKENQEETNEEEFDRT